MARTGWWGIRAHARAVSSSRRRIDENPSENVHIRVVLTALRDYSALVAAQAFVTKKTAGTSVEIFQEFGP